MSEQARQIIESAKALAEGELHQLCRQLAEAAGKQTSEALAECERAWGFAPAGLNLNGKGSKS